MSVLARFTISHTSDRSTLRRGAIIEWRGPSGSTVGRSPECDLVLGDPTVSRQHIKLWLEEGVCSIEVITTGNGTFLDEERLQTGMRRSLEGAKRLQLGGVLLEVELVPVGLASSTVSVVNRVRPKPRPISRTPDEAMSTTMVGRRAIEPDVVLEAGTLRLSAGLFLRGEEEVALTHTEVALLRYMLRRPGQDLSREQLLADVWGYVASVQSRSADTAVRRLRKKLERSSAKPRHLVTVPHVGYRFEP